VRDWKNRAHRLTSEPTWAHRKSGKLSWGTESRAYTPNELDKMKALVEQAIRKITPLPAQRERLRDRGLSKEGYFADVTIFDPMIR